MVFDLTWSQAENMVIIIVALPLARNPLNIIVN